MNAWMPLRIVILGNFEAKWPKKWFLKGTLKTDCEVSSRPILAPNVLNDALELGYDIFKDFFIKTNGV